VLKKQVISVGGAFYLGRLQDPLSCVGGVEQACRKRRVDLLNLGRRALLRGVS
jgi:hypothetical protein